MRFESTQESFDSSKFNTTKKNIEAKIKDELKFLGILKKPKVVVNGKLKSLQK